MPLLQPNLPTRNPVSTTASMPRTGARGSASTARAIPEMRGKRELLYYIGSGRRGRSYLFETDGFLFESPVNWYANKQTWDMAPAYQTTREMPLNLPAYTSCLNCHVSGMQPPAPGTDNRYPNPAFTHTGVACERCHGPGAAHVNGGAIVNPAKLPPARRDDICMQCHMEGKAAIERPGRHVYEFRPGDALSDYVRYFLLVNTHGFRFGRCQPGGGFGAERVQEEIGRCYVLHELPRPAPVALCGRPRCILSR